MYSRVSKEYRYISDTDMARDKITYLLDMARNEITYGPRGATGHPKAPQPFNIYLTLNFKTYFSGIMPPTFKTFEPVLMN